MSDTALVIGLATLIGLLIGSFMNVVILRLPLRLVHDWRTEACELLDLPTPNDQPKGLAFPPSHCPSCGHHLRWWHLFPVISYLSLRGRCAFCAQPISWQYPVVESLNAIWWAWCAWQFSTNLNVTLWWAVWGSGLITLAWIDARTMLLPDILTQPLLWAALLVAALHLGTVPMHLALWGAVAGYGLLWVPAFLYQRITGRMGMAPGDFKLLAAIGAALGPMALPSVVLCASFIGIGWGGIQAWRRHRADLPSSHAQAIPFGPALVLAALLARADWLPEVMHWGVGWH